MPALIVNTAFSIKNHDLLSQDASILGPGLDGPLLRLGQKQPSWAPLLVNMTHRWTKRWTGDGNKHQKANTNTKSCDITQPRRR